MLAQGRPEYSILLKGFEVLPLAVSEAVPFNLLAF